MHKQREQVWADPVWNDLGVGDKELAKQRAVGQLIIAKHDRVVQMERAILRREALDAPQWQQDQRDREPENPRLYLAPTKL